ncbi:protein of unknown function [Burkholderia multivorans]
MPGGQCVPVAFTLDGFAQEAKFTETRGSHPVFRTGSRCLARGGRDAFRSRRRHHE